MTISNLFFLQESQYDSLTSKKSKYSKGPMIANVQTFGGSNQT